MSEIEPEQGRTARWIGRASRERDTASPDDAPTDTDSSEAYAPRGFVVSLEKLFMICLFAGLGLAVAGMFVPDPVGRRITLLSPVLATIAYPLLGLACGYQRSPSLRERFADNCYYLGFIFTQGGLLFAFLPSTMFNQQITSTQVIQFFGMAIGAALSGLIARTLLIQSGTSLTDLGDRVHGEVVNLANQITAESKQVIDRFETISAALGEVPEQLVDRLERQFGQVDEVLNRLRDALTGTLSGFEQGQATVSAAVEGTAAKSAEAAITLEGAVQEAANAIRKFGVEINGQTSAAIAALRESTDSLRASLVAFEKVGSLGDDLPDLQREVADLRNASAGARKAATDLTDSFGKAVKDGEANIAAAVDEGARSIRATTGESVAAISDAVARGTSSIQQTATQAVTDLEGAARQNVADVTSQAQQFREQLDKATSSFEAVLTAFSERLAALAAKT